jgi:polysaccharide transporter, PST family
MAVHEVVSPRLLKAFGWGTMRAVTRLVCSFASIKVTSVYLGPTGLALIAQFNNFMSLCQAIVATGLDTATGRLTAEYHEDGDRCRALWGTVGRIGMGLGLAMAILIVATSYWLSTWLLLNADLQWVFFIGAAAVVCGTFNSVLLAAMAARREIGMAAGSGILATIMGLVIFVPSSVHFGVQGGLVASALAYIASFLITLLMANRMPSMPLRDFAGKLNRHEAARIVRFYPMLIVHAVIVPLTPIVIRDQITTLVNLEATGLWQACSRLSETYMMVISASVSLHFQPRLGEVVNSPQQLRAEVLRTIGASLAVTASMGIALLVFREWVVRLVLSPAFLPVVDLVPVQILGDVFKMAGWLSGFVLVATVRTPWFIAAELVVPVVFVAATRLLVPEFGVVGANMAYVMAYFVQFMVTVYALRKIVFLRSPPT